ncbi:hypothetical protein SBA4_40008 [Candidatus Sulfopaludibacter sp. SbA4]|nr:hypothetical protein SBA4_40008 [Candidatus Sulfopaludibacter sp. SbA4]
MRLPLAGLSQAADAGSGNSEEISAAGSQGSGAVHPMGAKTSPYQITPDARDPVAGSGLVSGSFVWTSTGRACAPRRKGREAARDPAGVYVISDYRKLSLWRYWARSRFCTPVRPQNPVKP